MRWAAVALLTLSTLWFAALVIAAIDALPAILEGQVQGPESASVVIAYGLGGVVLGGCSVVLTGVLARSPRAGRSPPRWARRLAFACAGALAIVAVAGLGSPVTILMGLPALAFAAAGFQLAARGPSGSSPAQPPRG